MIIIRARDNRQDDGSVAFHQPTCGSRLEYDRHDSTQHGANRELRHSARDNASQNASRVGAERDPDPDLFPTLRDRERDQRVNPCRRKNEDADGQNTQHRGDQLTSNSPTSTRLNRTSWPARDHDTHDRIRRVAELDRPSHYRRITAEPISPCVVADDQVPVLPGRSSRTSGGRACSRIQRAKPGDLGPSFTGCP